MSLFHIFTFPVSSVPVCPDIVGNGTQKTYAGIGRRTLQGTLQEGHPRRTGQGK
ncbi:unnamed protein product [Staurois parvus]|uniref:Uncharacterized protein n=1 Tax=Staurois parvus TaxID=386267 RepID=A0ABN9FDT3_9NEOB|nr:unnamed protein product [Staurois parvus]